MSDPNGTRPRPTLSAKTPRTVTSDDERARRLYGKTSSDEALASALRAAKSGSAVGVKPADLSMFNHDFSALSGTVDLGTLGNLGDPNCGLGSAVLFGLGGPDRPLNEILGVAPTADFGDPSDKYQRFTLKRDRDRPLAFDGRIVAEVEEQQFNGQVVIRAAIYETQAGKFVTEMTRREINPPGNYGVGKRPFLFAKASVFVSLDIAAMSFRTHGGRLTEALLRQIGDVDPEFVE